MVLYKATNHINKKSYIGKTLFELKDRKYGHEKAAIQGSNTYFHKALRKYGFENFQWEVLGYYDCNEELCEAEQGYIEYCRKWLNIPLYNMTNGGEGRCGIVVSEETRIKLSNVLKGKKRSQETKKLMSLMKNMLGKHHSKKSKKQISMKLKNHTVSKETREKIRQSHLGKTLSPEHKQKLRDAAKRRYSK